MEPLKNSFIFFTNYRKIRKMQKMVILCGVFMGLLSGCAASRVTDVADGDFGPAGVAHADWTAFQFGPWLFDKQTPVYGLAMGLGGETEGSRGVFLPLGGYSFRRDNYGISCGLGTDIPYNGSFSGVSCDFIYFANPFERSPFPDETIGVTNGVAMDLIAHAHNVNGVFIHGLSVSGKVRGLSIGAISACDVTGVQICAIASSTTNGIQISALSENTSAGPSPSSPKPWCVSLGIINLSDGDGVLIGVFNDVSSSGNALQIGLLNHNESGIVPWLPLLNWRSIGDDN